jgi:hypothetical protein
MQSRSHRADESLRMLDAFASVGATHFDVTFLDIDGNKRGFRKQQSVQQLRNSLPHLRPGLTQRQQSLVVRPLARDGVTLIQLDDLTSEHLRPLESTAFLTLETSPGNHQAWVAVSGLNDAKDFSRRLRKGAGADATASGATRVAGTLNYKRKYHSDFPTVAITQATPGRIVTPEQLEALGLVVAPEPAASAAPLRDSSSGRRNWPDYERCMAGAPPNHGNTGPDISRADFFYGIMAARRGFSLEEIAGHLMQVSVKAQENGEAYARRTAENATEAAFRNAGMRVRS